MWEEVKIQATTRERRNGNCCKPGESGNVTFALAGGNGESRRSAEKSNYGGFLDTAK